MRTLLSVLLGLGGEFIFELSRVVQELVALTSRHLPARGDYARMSADNITSAAH